MEETKKANSKEANDKKNTEAYTPQQIVEDIKQKKHLFINRSYCHFIENATVKDFKPTATYDIFEGLNKVDAEAFLNEALETHLIDDRQLLFYLYHSFRKRLVTILEKADKPELAQILLNALIALGHASELINEFDEQGKSWN